MIRVRDDDVLISSKGTDNPLKKFQMVHEWICEVPEKLIHVPTILVTEIQEFPEAIEYVRQETLEGRMLPEIHGLTHKDYASLPTNQIVQELEICRDWIHAQFGHVATKFYSPWGAGFDARGAHIRPAAASIGIELVTCEHINKMNGRYGVIKNLRDGKSIDYLDGDEIFLHWWESMARLRRIIEVIKHGSWGAAKDANKKLFREEK
jgi:peptidoglycan/xylan/chitin deacetylase (PgdA/CDA1 family)